MPVSANVEAQVDPPGNGQYVEDAWELKETIRESEGVLKQRRPFFVDAYRRSKVHLLSVDDELAGFASVRRDGYILFLAVGQQFRGEGFGERLIAEAVHDHDNISCHARATNEEALSFYQHLGFETVRRIGGYYEDGGDAYYLRLGESQSLRERFADLIKR